MKPWIKFISFEFDNVLARRNPRHPDTDKVKGDFAGLKPHERVREYIRHERMRTGEIEDHGKPDSIVDASIEALEELLREDYPNKEQREFEIEMARQACALD